MNQERMKNLEDAIMDYTGFEHRKESFFSYINGHGKNTLEDEHTEIISNYLIHEKFNQAKLIQAIEQAGKDNSFALCWLVLHDK